MKEIKLTRGKVAFVDDDDFEWLSQWKWFASKSRNKWYAHTNYRKHDGTWGKLSMHSCVMNFPQQIFIDHANGNGLDCQKHNLRAATRSQNGANRTSSLKSSSHYLGVSFYRRRLTNPWGAFIRKDKKLRYLGTFSTDVDAAKAYDTAAKELHGEFANLNFKN